MIPSRIFWIFFLSFFLSCRCLKPVLASEEGGYIPAIPVAGSRANQNDVNAFQNYQSFIWEAQKDQKALQEKMLTALKATNDLVREIEGKITEKCKRLAFPASFLEELKGIKKGEIYALFDESQRCQLAAEYNPQNLEPLTEAIENFHHFFQKWDAISRNLEDTVRLAINQTLWHQGEWSLLFGQGACTIKGCDLYKWVASFHKALDSLQISDDNLQETSSPSDLTDLWSHINKDLTHYYTEKNVVLWELATSFLKALPEYEDLPDNFFLQPNPCEWMSYLFNLPNGWPTAKNWVQEESRLTEIASLVNDFQLTLADKNNLTPEEMESIRGFWRDNGKNIWDFLRGSMKKLPPYDQLLDNLYPNTEDFEKALNYGKFLKVLKILDLWNQPINIPQDLSKKITDIFSPSEEWEERVKTFKSRLKPFSNVKFIINLLPGLQKYYGDFAKQYQENFGKTYDPYAPVVSGTMLDGSRFILPQSMACKIFPALYEQVTYLLDRPFKSYFVSLPSIQCLRHHSNLDIGEEYAWYFLEKLFGLPAQLSALAFFDNILIQRPSGKIFVKFANGFGMKSRHVMDIHDKIDYQRELRLQESLRNPDAWRSSFKTAFGLMQEQFTGIFLEDFLKDIAKGKRPSFDELDADSVGRQILFLMLTQSSVPLKNWGLIEENEKLVLARVNRGDEGIKNHSFLRPVFQYIPGIESESQRLPDQHILTGRNILYFLPFADQKISAAVREEFLSHDILLMLSHWMAELRKTQGSFEDLMRQKNASSVQQSDEMSQDQGIGELKISLCQGMIQEIIHNFKVMQKVLKDQDATPLKLLKKLRPQEFAMYQDILHQVKEETTEQKETKLFFENVILPFIAQLKETPFNQDVLEAAQQQCLIRLGYYPESSIEDLLGQIESNAIKCLLTGLYEATKEGAFVEAYNTLKACEYLTNRKELFAYEDLLSYGEFGGAQSTEPWSPERVYFRDYGEEALASENSLPVMIESLISLANINEYTPEQQVKIISLLLDLMPQPQSFHPGWQELFETIGRSKDPAFIRKFRMIYPRLQQIFQQSPEKSVLTVQNDGLKEEIALHEFNHYAARLQGYEKKEGQAPEKVAGDYFRQLWYGSLESLTSAEEVLFNALLDLLLLPRYAGLTDLPEELCAMAAYLESTGFASHNHQHVGRSKSSQAGPINLELGDGQHYVLSWSERCATFLQSPHIIPARICDTIASHDVHLLCLQWLRHLQENAINITFYPWFIETTLEKATKMQKLMVTRPFLTFQEVMQDLWPPIFYAYQQQFKTLPDAKKLCEHLKDQIKQFHDLKTLNSSDVDLDWLPDGKFENLESILENMDIKKMAYFSRPPLSLTEAAVEVLADAIPKVYGLTVTKMIFNGIAANIVDQMAQNFLDAILQDRSFLLKNRALFDYIYKVLTDPDTKVSETSRKLIFALEGNLMAGVSSQYLVWDETMGTFSLSRLDIKGGTAQTYLDCLTQSLTFLSEEPTEAAAKTWHTGVVALAIDQLATNFWEKALAFEEKRSDLWQWLTAENATLNAWKLAFAWAYGLPKETSRDDLGFAIDSRGQPVMTGHPYTLTALTVSGADLGRSKLEFLAPFSGGYQITLCPNSQVFPTEIKPTELILFVNRKKDLVCQVQGKEGEKIRTKDFPKSQSHLVSKLKKYVGQERWGAGLEHEKKYLLNFILSKGWIFSGLTKLELVQCGLISTSFLPGIENLDHLNLGGNKIRGLAGLYNEETFKFPKLQTLNLSHNILDFTKDDWDGWKNIISHIREVDFSHNHISFPPLMNACLLPENNPMEGKHTCFKMDHNKIRICDLHKFYDFRFFREDRNLGITKKIDLKSKNHNPVHIYYQEFLDETSYCIQFYEVIDGKDSKKTIVFYKTGNRGVGDREVGNKIYNIIRNLNLHTDENKDYLFSLIIKNNNNINTSRLSVWPQNATK